MVSVEPRTQAASLLTKASAPLACITSSIMAHDPDPLRGFMSMVGNAPTHCVSNPSQPRKASTHPVKTSSAPEALNMPIATKIATR